jgi:hypothetical protein
MTTTLLYDQLTTDMNMNALSAKLREIRRPTVSSEAPAASLHLRSALAAAQPKSATDKDKKTNSIFIGIQIPSAS